MNDLNLFFLAGISDPSSDDEPLINLVKKRQAPSKVKSPKKNKTPTILREQQVYGKHGAGVKLKK